MRLNLGISAALFVFTFAVFWPITGYDFVNFDDPGYVIRNPVVKKGFTAEGVKWAFTTNEGGNWHPVTWFSHMLDCQLFGLNAGRQHAVSLALHGGSVVMLFLLLTHLTGARWRSVMVAGVFAVHPLRVESVAWISERKDVLSGFFFMLTLWAYVRWIEVRGEKGEGRVSNSRVPAPVFYVAPLFLFALGLMSKPMLVTVPVVLLLLDVWPLRRLKLPIANSQSQRADSKEPRDDSPTQISGDASLARVLVEKVPFFLLAAVMSAVTIVAQKEIGAMRSMDTLPLGSRFANAVNSIWVYVVKVFWPSHLNVMYPIVPIPTVQVIAASVGVVISIALAIWCVRRWPYVTVGWFWFLVMLTPVLGIIQVGSQAWADRYSYLPSIGFFLALVWGITNLVRKVEWARIGAVGVGAAAVIACVVTTRAQLPYWQNGIELSHHWLRLYPNDARGHFNLGFTYFLMGDRKKAIDEFNIAVSILPTYEKAHNDLGIALMDEGRLPEAEQHFRTVLQMDPDYLNARRNLARLLVNQNRWADALPELTAGLRKDKPDPDFERAIAEALMRLGRTKEAIPHLEETARIKPAPDLYLGIAQLQIQNGDMRGAVRNFEAALRLKPDMPETLCKVAWIEATTEDASIRNGRRAVECGERACNLTKFQVGPFVMALAAAYAEAGRFDDAMKTGEKARSIAERGNNQGLVQKLDAMLEDFRKHQAYREKLTQ